MISDSYVWFVWSSAFLIPWLVIFAVFPRHRRAMTWASLFTMPFGFTEPLFVPEYWTPPSLFDLARRTGFDLESLVFCFAIGGIGAVMYNVATGQELRAVGTWTRHHPSHRYHMLALAAPFLAFPLLYFLPCNPIYPSIAAMSVGAIATMVCRRDLVRKTWIGGFLFLGYYAVFLAGLEWLAPGFVARVWNLEALSGWVLFGVPLEELAFAAAFGAYWSGVYEHFTWRRSADIH